MGTRGPVPKRSEERIRRNKDEGPVETIEIVGEFPVPELGFDDPHPMIVDFYESLKDSGQSRFYEPSDWQHARIVCHFLDGQIKSSRPSGQMLATLHSMMTDLLISEGARRRVRLEIEREQAKNNVIDVAQMFRDRLAK